VRRELALWVLVPVALVVLAFLLLQCQAALLRSALRVAESVPPSERLDFNSSMFIAVVVLFLFMGWLALSFIAGYLTYTTLTVDLGWPEEAAALAAIGVGVLSWFAQLVVLNHMLGG